MEPSDKKGWLSFLSLSLSLLIGFQKDQDQHIEMFMKQDTFHPLTLRHQKDLMQIYSQTIVMKKRTKEPGIILMRVLVKRVQLLNLNWQVFWKIP